ncbi:uncharacterized protein K441DRAFT_734709 [Cenococcum geophilum 1.58]|uniref:uncharacterized protein n=1 Tax=Cenococcum geophilum 1.58 TaxID=794803 RepID=UPI00358F2157|nr:hypothetical protein K441DRAFT_734709 [Cenococcum geophilum 1.58]
MHFVIERGIVSHTIRMEDRTFDPNGDITLIMRSHLEDDQTSERTTTTESVIESTPMHVRMLVSSKHLVLASSVFGAMLQGRFNEGQTLRSAGYLELPLPDDDPVAFSILLDVIHGHTRKVPHKYQLQEVVEVFSDGWVQALSREVPASLTADLIHWLCIFWVFGQSDKFKLMTRIMERESGGTIWTEDLPIPPAVLDAIENKRQGVIASAISMLTDLITNYQNSTPRCPRSGDNAFKCDAMVLGALIKSSISIGLWPPPAPPFTGISFCALSGQIHQMKVPTLCDTIGQTEGWYGSRGDYPYYDRGELPAHIGIKESIEASFRSLEDQLCGLDISTFKA